MKIQIALAFVVVFVSGIAFGMDITLVEKIKLSQEKTFIQAPASIAVTEDNIIFLNDFTRDWRINFRSSFNTFNRTQFIAFGNSITNFA